MQVFVILRTDNARAVISGQLVGKDDSMQPRVGIVLNLNHGFCISICLDKYKTYLICSLPFLALLPVERMGISSPCASFVVCFSLQGYTRPLKAECGIREARSVVCAGGLLLFFH